MAAVAPSAAPTAPAGTLLTTQAGLLLVFALGIGIAGASFSMIRAALGALDVEECSPGESDRGFWRLRTHPATLADDQTFDRSCGAAALLANFTAVMLAIDFGARVFHATPIVGGVLVGLLMVSLQFVLVEVAARHVSLRHPAGMLRALGWMTYLATLPLRPLVAAVLRTIDPASRQPALRHVRTRELRLLPHVRGVDRLVEEEAVEMMDSVREFIEGTARDVMTPRTEIEGVPRTIGYDELIRRLQETPYSRLVVFEENLDHIVGVLLAKEILLNRPAQPFDLMRRPLMVSQDTRLPELLQQFRSARTYLAVVLDSYGGTAGIVTIHDLFEQIVGTHIEDEEEEEELWIDMRDDDHALLSGRVELWEVNQELELDLDESVARTLGGYLMYRFGHLPQVGEEWPVNRGIFRVASVDGTRIETIEFRRDASAREAPEPAEETIT